MPSTCTASSKHTQTMSTMSSEHHAGADDSQSQAIDRGLIAAAGLLRCGPCDERASVSDRFCGACGSVLDSLYDIIGTQKTELMWFDGIWRATDSIGSMNAGRNAPRPEDHTSTDHNQMDQTYPPLHASSFLDVDNAHIALAREARRRLSRSVFWVSVTSAPLAISASSHSGFLPDRWFLVAVASYGWLRLAISVRTFLYPERLFDDGLRHSERCA